VRSLGRRMRVGQKSKEFGVHESMLGEGGLNGDVLPSHGEKCRAVHHTQQAEYHDHAIHVLARVAYPHIGTLPEQ